MGQLTVYISAGEIGRELCHDGSLLGEVINELGYDFHDRKAFGQRFIEDVSQEVGPEALVWLKALTTALDQRAVKG